MDSTKAQTNNDDCDKPASRKKSLIGDLYKILTSKDEDIVKRLTDNENDYLQEDNHYQDDSNDHEKIQENKNLASINNDTAKQTFIETTFDGNETSVKRTFCERYFSPLEAGSLRSSIFNLVAFSLGVGSQSLPDQFTKMSLLMGLIMIFVCAVSCFYSLKILNYSCEKAGLYDYSKLVKSVIGPKASLMLNIVIMLYISGSVIAYQLNGKYVLVIIQLHSF